MHHVRSLSLSLAAVVLALSSASAPVVLHAMQQVPAEAPAPVTVPLAMSPEVADPGGRTRCRGCGFVQSIRNIEAAGLVPASYEMTVRMRDGSVRTSSSASAGSWLVGDRIILVGGPQITAN